jgi:hypothetical protein
MILDRIPAGAPVRVWFTRRSGHVRAGLMMALLNARGGEFVTSSRAPAGRTDSRWRASDARQELSELNTSVPFLARRKANSAKITGQVDTLPEPFRRAQSAWDGQPRPFLIQHGALLHLERVRSQLVVRTRYISCGTSLEQRAHAPG